MIFLKTDSCGKSFIAIAETPAKTKIIPRIFMLDEYIRLILFYGVENVLYPH